MATNTYVALATQTLGSAAASVTFSSIPQGYTDLRLVVSSSNTSGDSGVVARFNGDTGTNYSNTGLYGNGSSAASFRESNQTRVYVGRHDTTISTSLAEIQNYSNTTTNKTLLSRGNDATLTITTAGLWRSTSAISSIVVFDQSGLNFNAGSTFTIYGIAATSVGAKATGGTIYSDASYYYHVFNASGTFTPTQSINADVLCVAGGGGGGGHLGGGGGAGGVIYFENSSVASGTNYTVTVGAGGSNTVNMNATNTNGSNSSFGALTAAIGGGKGGEPAGVGFGVSGGSGSGGGGNNSSTVWTGGATTQTGTGATTYYGNIGGSGSTGNTISSAGGGGGAGAAGGNGVTNSIGGAGGIGTNAFLSWTTATGTGVSGFFAGGGGGGVDSRSSATSGGPGGTGGGGAGVKGDPSTAVSGTANTGGGGGGGSGGSGGVTTTSGSGGSGIVIVRYAK